MGSLHVIIIACAVLHVLIIACAVLHVSCIACLYFCYLYAIKHIQVILLPMRQVLHRSVIPFKSSLNYYLAGRSFNQFVRIFSAFKPSRIIPPNHIAFYPVLDSGSVDLRVLKMTIKNTT